LFRRILLPGEKVRMRAGFFLFSTVFGFMRGFYRIIL